jgi:hypothetical protein
MNFTKTNSISKERFETQLFGVGKIESVALSGRLNVYFLQKGIKQKVNLMKQSQDSFL